MNASKEKARGFLNRLLQNPALSTMSELQREQQILQFLSCNMQQLLPTLSSPYFFPGMNWVQIRDILAVTLSEHINTMLSSKLEGIIKERIGTDFIYHVSKRNVEGKLIHKELSAIAQRFINTPTAKSAFTGPYTALYFDIAKRYLQKVFKERTYVHFELTKVQRLRMQEKDICHFVNMCMLLKPAVSLVLNEGKQQQFIIDVQQVNSITQYLQKELPSIPESILKSCVRASMSFSEHQFLEATARFAAIISARGKQYHTGIKVDRGADTPDKSWINIARRNYKFNGFDVKMLDELYRIAAESYW